jgi:hypothetical protein
MSIYGCGMSLLMRDKWERGRGDIKACLYAVTEPCADLCACPATARLVQDPRGASQPLPAGCAGLSRIHIFYHMKCQ